MHNSVSFSKLLHVVFLFIYLYVSSKLILNFELVKQLKWVFGKIWKQDLK